jgi:D-serine deaminase-like pyridoxal phosphate-dependent protein
MAADHEGLKAEIARIYGTPAVVIDLDKVEANIARLPGRLRCQGRRQPPAYQDA